MKDNISLIFAVIFAVFVLIILPLLSITSRQDSISYNKVLTLTTNFVDDVRTKGYLTEEDYTNYLVALSATSNTYKVEMEWHDKVLIKDITSGESDVYTEDTLVYYNKDILTQITSEDGDATDEDILRFNVDDEFYVKVYNTNITTASLLYNFFARVNIPDKIINIGYGGKVSHSSGSNFTQTNFESAYTPNISFDIIENKASADTAVAEGKKINNNTDYSIGMDYQLVSTGIGDYKKAIRYLNTEYEKDGKEDKLVIYFILNRFASIGNVVIEDNMTPEGDLNDEAKTAIATQIENYLSVGGEIVNIGSKDVRDIKATSTSKGIEITGIIEIKGITLEENIYRSSSYVSIKSGLGTGNTGILSSSGVTEEIILTRPTPSITIRRTNEYQHLLEADDSVEFEITANNLPSGLTYTFKLIAVSLNEEIPIDGTNVTGELTNGGKKVTLTVNKLAAKYIGHDLKLVVETKYNGKTIKGDSDKFVYVNDLVEYNITNISYTGYTYNGNTYTSSLSTYTINQGESLKINAKIKLDKTIAEEDKDRIKSLVLNNLVLKNNTLGPTVSTTISVNEITNDYANISFTVPSDSVGTNEYYMYYKKDDSVDGDKFTITVKAVTAYEFWKIEYVDYEYDGISTLISYPEQYNIYEGETLTIKAKITLDKWVAGDFEAKKASIAPYLRLKNLTTGKYENVEFTYYDYDNQHVWVSFNVPVTLGVYDYDLVSDKDSSVSAPDDFTVSRSVVVQNYNIEKIECDFDEYNVECFYKEGTQLTFNVYMSEEVYKTDGLVEHIKNNIELVLDEDEEINNFENYVKIEYKDLEVDNNNRKLLKVTYNVDYFKYRLFGNTFDIRLGIDVKSYGEVKEWFMVGFIGISYTLVDNHSVYLGQEILFTEKMKFSHYIETEKMKEYFMKYYSKKQDSNPIFESVEIKDIRYDNYDFYVDYVVKITESSEYAGKYGSWIGIEYGEQREYSETFYIVDTYFDKDYETNVNAYINKERLFVEFDYLSTVNPYVETLIEKTIKVLDSNYNIDLADFKVSYNHITLEFAVLNSDWTGQSVNGNISIGNLDLEFTAEAVDWVWDSFELHTEYYMYKDLYFDYEIEGYTKDEIRSYLYSIIKFNNYSDDTLSYWVDVYDDLIDISISSEYEGSFTLFVGSRRFEYDSDSGFKIEQ